MCVKTVIFAYIVSFSLICAMKKSTIESRIKWNALFIYLLVALACGGIFVYLFTSWESINARRESINEYNNRLSQVSELIYLVNKAQEEVNLYAITGKRKHLQQFKEQAKNISLCIDTLKITQNDPEADTILSEISRLLKRKEQSVILLNRQIMYRNPIDSLSNKLAVLTTSTNNEPESEQIEAVIDTVPAPQKRNLWNRIFSSSKKKKDKEIDTDAKEIKTIAAENTSGIIQTDSAQINKIVEEARVNYDQHISAIGNRVNSIVLTDQYITSQITELLIMLYNRIIQMRIDELDSDEETLRKNNVIASVVGSIAMLLILLSIILILHYANKGYSARKALEQANNRTRQLMESRHKLLLSVSHDVKTPLNSILSYVDIYRREGILTDEEAAPVNNSGNHILALLGNLLEFSSLEKGSVALAHGNFSLYKSCEEVCEMFAPLAQKKSLGFDYRPCFAPNLVLFADCLKIKQILINILSNAVKYTTEGGITFDVSCEDNILSVQVTDTGVGIPADKQDKLFTPFSRVEENSILDEGSGFGLYVTKGLVDLFGGKISFHSVQGKGTQVTVTLPVREGRNPQTDQSAKKLLIVDDDPLFLDVLSQQCQQLGHEVTTCKSPGEFTETIKDINRYDCVLTDMEMDNFTGKDVLKKVRGTKHEMPVVLITGRDDYAPDLILSEGFTDYLLKPVTLQSLHTLIGGSIAPDMKVGTRDMERFLMATVDNIVLLEEAAANRDFGKFRFLCHRMLPMFLLTEAPAGITNTLKYVNNLREENNPGSDFWEHVSPLKNQIETFLQDIREKYLSD